MGRAGVARVAVGLLALALGVVAGRAGAIGLVARIASTTARGSSELGESSAASVRVTPNASDASDASTPTTALAVVGQAKANQHNIESTAVVEAEPPSVVVEVDPSLPTRGVLGAAARGDVEALIVALDERQDMSSRDIAGRTPLAIAAQAGQLGALELLATRGGRLNSTTHDGRTPLILASQASKGASVRWLLAHGAATTGTDRLGHTALIHAAMAGHVEIADTLVRGGAKLDTRCERGLTALMHAVRAREWKVAAALLVHHPALEHRDRTGATALALAADRGMSTTVQRLIDAGAEVDSANYAGLTPLGYALSRRGGLNRDERRAYERSAERLADAGARFSRLHRSNLVGILNRGRFDRLAARHGARPLPQAARLSDVPDHVRKTPGGAGTRLLRMLPRRNSRAFPARLDQRLFAISFERWRVANVLQRVRITGLNPRAGQRITLAGDVAGQWSFTVDNALLFETERARGREAFYIGYLHHLRISGTVVPRRGRRRFRFRADRFDITDAFKGGAPVVLSVLDSGGAGSVSEIYLRVLGPGAVETLGRARIKELR